MIDISNTTRSVFPKKYNYNEMAAAVLGNKYELSLVFCGEHLMRKINRESRGKDYATNILSFPLSGTTGEMFICLPVCKKQYKNFDRTFENFVGFLFVHGLVHLKGHDHGATMDRLESKFRKQFGI